MPTPEKIVKNINIIQSDEIAKIKTKTPQRKAYLWALYYKDLNDKKRVADWKQYLKDEKKIANGPKRPNPSKKIGGKGSIKRTRAQNKTKRMPRK